VTPRSDATLAVPDFLDQQRTVIRNVRWQLLRAKLACRSRRFGLSASTGGFKPDGGLGLACVLRAEDDMLAQSNQIGRRHRAVMCFRRSR
jgi:hypothetical protein